MLIRPMPESNRPIIAFFDSNAIADATRAAARVRIRKTSGHLVEFARAIGARRSICAARRLPLRDGGGAAARVPAAGAPASSRSGRAGRRAAVRSDRGGLPDAFQ